MTNCQEIYDALHELVNESLSAGSEMNVWYAQDSYDDHLFLVTGEYYGRSSENIFTEFHEFTTEFEPDDVEISHTSDGAHIRFAFDADEVEGGKPKPARSIDRVDHRGAETETVNECSNCRRSVGGLPYPPAVFVYPSDDSLEGPTEEEHHLCTTCSPGHYDDVVRGVDYFAVEDGRISRIGFIDQGDSWDSEPETKWEDRDEVDNPFIMDTVEVLEKELL